MIASPTSSIPCIARTGVLVLGSTAAGVSAALNAHAAGEDVYLVSDRSYVGEELAAWLGEFPQKEELGKTLAALFQDSGSEPSPLSIKRTLEQSLMEKGIPFLFNSRPVGLLENGEGRVTGVVFAARCAWFAIRAKHVIDATRFGLGAALGPWKSERRGRISAGFSALAHAEKGGRTVSVFNDDKEPLSFEVRTFDVAVDCTNTRIADLLEYEAAARKDFFFPGQVKTSDSLKMASPWKFESIPESYGISLVGSAAMEESVVDFQKLFSLAESAGARAAKLASARSHSEKAVWMKGSATGSIEGLHYGPTPLRWRQSDESLAVDSTAYPILDEVDVLVVGGGTGGASAGIGAARSGARTLLIEALPGLGGVGTLGLIGKYWFGNRVGFTAEIDKGSAEMGTSEMLAKFTGGWNPEWKMAWYLQEIAKAGGRVWFGSSAAAVQLENGKVTGVLVSTPFGCGWVRARSVIDSTGNADIPAAAGAPFRAIGSNHVAVQGTGLPPRKPDAGYRNTDYTFVDENDPLNITQSFVTAREKFRNEFDLAQIVDSRERRQIVGELELSPLDFLADRTFPDTMVIAKSNFDTHGFTTHPVFMTFPPDKKPLNARVPFRCLLPKGLEGVLVTGLGVSAHRDAIPVIRMQPDVQNQGYAAGIAAAIASRNQCGFRDLNIRDLQKQWVDCGILPAEVLQEQDSFPLADSAIQEAIRSGIKDHTAAAVILGNPERSIPLLEKEMKESGDPTSAENAALLLGMLGQISSAPALIKLISERDWDKGWNYTGMGQFGMSMSRLDALIMALGRTGDLSAIPLLRKKIESLDAGSEFSHCRAVAIAASCLRSPALAESLASVLKLPGMSGHSRSKLNSVVQNTPLDPEETLSRNLSLRELVLARGLNACGDFQGSGKHILEEYSRDLRGHYVNHAVALLQETIDTSAPASIELRLEMA